MMNATAFAGPDVRARPIKAAALGVMTDGVRPGPFGHDPVAAVDRVRPLPQPAARGVRPAGETSAKPCNPAARIPPMGGPRGKPRPSRPIPWRGFPRRVAREGNFGQAARRPWRGFPRRVAR